MTLMDRFDHPLQRWKTWWGAAFPVAVPVPAAVDIPGRDAVLAAVGESGQRRVVRAATRGRHHVASCGSHRPDGRDADLSVGDGSR